MVIKRGELWWADLGEPRGSEAGFERPVAIVQDNFINRSRIATVVIVPFTSNRAFGKLLGNVLIEPADGRLSVASIAQVHLIQALPRDRLLRYLGVLPSNEMDRIDLALQQTLGLIPES